MIPQNEEQMVAALKASIEKVKAEKAEKAETTAEVLSKLDSPEELARVKALFADNRPLKTKKLRKPSARAVERAFFGDVLGED